MSKKHKKINYVSKLARVMEEGQRSYSDKINHKEYAKTTMYGNATNRLNELHEDNCPRVNELAVIIDKFVNTIASGKSCMSRRGLVKIGYEILNQHDEARENTRKHMEIYE
tara:strand:- start:223 stop:555 length:333 start_codon:yes stop_codon:yes gene_type:complete